MSGLATALSRIFAATSILLVVATVLSLIFRLDFLVTGLCAIFAVSTAFSAFMYGSAGN
jgi:hypothetical protein